MQHSRGSPNPEDVPDNNPLLSLSLAPALFGRFRVFNCASLGAEKPLRNPAAINTTPAPTTDHRSLRLLDDQRCVYVFVLRKRAVAQPLEPVWWKSSLQERSLRPQRHSVFHVRDRARLQSFMSSPLFQTEDPEKSPTKILLSY
ncbi:hypothetical protein PFLUV_G00228780 [Perca fluviatilis]|uniref:Uncharacterized protein n=1 Tax=Perca fluviatilis TaxID=8168 RepID=A0A6A5DQ66_PERFL|nr:hypothetical protein PFLUV_G00228780 [Perca fluviatilis]